MHENLERRKKGLILLLEYQACKLQFRLRDITSCLYSVAALAICYKGRVAGVDGTEAGKEFSQLKF